VLFCSERGGFFFFPVLVFERDMTKKLVSFLLAFRLFFLDWRSFSSGASFRKTDKDVRLSPHCLP